MVVCRSSRASVLLLVAALAILAGGDSPLAATITASSCSQSNVASAIAAASAGDIVQVPAGSCSWSGLSINKAIHLRGAGVGQTQITLTGSNTVSKQSNGVTRISRFSFS
jgi:hypothetical protein